jgi:hypothetical protein
VARANISEAYDVYNEFLPDIGIHLYTGNEIKDAKEHIPEIKEIVGERPVILIFDRNYASPEFIDYVEAEGCST